MVLRRPVDARGFLEALHTISRISLVQRATAGRAARGGIDDDPTTLGGARLPLDDLIVCRLHRRRLCNPATGWDKVGSVVTDDRGGGLDLLLLLLLLLPAMQAQSILNRKQESTHGNRAARDAHHGGLVGFAAHHGVCLAILAVDVVGHVQSVLVSTATERAVLLMNLQRVGALVAVAGVAFKVGHDILLVGLELAHGHDGLRDVLDDGGRHSGRSTQGQSSARNYAREYRVPDGGSFVLAKQTRCVEGRHCDGLGTSRKTGRGTGDSFGGRKPSRSQTSRCWSWCWS